jgi:transposase
VFAVTPNAATRARVKKLVQAGKSGSQIAKAVGISLPSVHNIKKALWLVKSRGSKVKQASAKKKPAKKMPAKKRSVKKAPAKKAFAPQPSAPTAALGE